jgi:four helix bundle protein
LQRVAGEGNAELARFLQIAMGSASELQYHFLLAHDLTFLKAAEYENLSTRVIELKRMLAALLQRVRAAK